MTDSGKDFAIGVFDRDAQAEQAVAALWQAGFASDRIDMANRRTGVVAGTPRLQFQQDAGDGATAGAMAGATVGAVAGAVIGSIVPVIGTAIGGLGGAALGAAGGTFLGPFVAMGASEEEARHYSTIVNEGRTLVIVHEVGRLDEAWEIMRNHGGRKLENYLTPPSSH